MANRSLRIVLPLIFSILFQAHGFAQSLTPEIWLIADSVANNQLYFSQHGTKKAQIHYDSTDVFLPKLLNGHSVIDFSGTNALLIPTEWLSGRNIQALIAYLPDSSQSMHGLYEFIADQ